MSELILGAAGRERDRVVRRRPGFAGIVGAVLFFCLSLTPSLLPRDWLLQGLLSGITTAIGYAVGATIGALVRMVWPGVPELRRRAWLLLAGAGGGLAAVFLGLGLVWEAEVRRLVGASAVPPWHPVPVVLLAAVGFGLLLLLARTLRLLTRRLTDALGRFSPRPVASVTAVGLVAALSYALGPAMAFPGFVDAADRTAAHANQATAPGLTPPASPLVSGGPGSLVPWDSLGAYGREFTTGAVSPAQLAGFGGGTMPPVRVYVGRDSAPTADERADLAVRELGRTGGFDRAVLGIVITTGTGWVNPAVPAALEYLHGGDTAIVATQYSYLPSWLSFVADRSAATESAEALIGAVQDRLAAMPAHDRPQLVLYGESLGSHAIESTFGDLDAMLATTDGVVLAGPPHTNPIWGQVTAERDPESPIWRPDCDEPVWFGQEALNRPVAGDRPGLVYLQNATDPVVFWTPELLYQAPEWLDSPRGPDVSGAVRWYPMVTFWQVTVDLLRSTKAPPGHGHAYQQSVADAWAALVAPPGWTDADTARLRDQLPDRTSAGGAE